MKKVLISLFAVAAMVSCSNDELVELNQQAIAFGDNFIENSTRADYSQAANKVQRFKVYGTATGTNDATVQIFNGVTISRPTGVVDGSDTAWTQEVGTAAQFWLPSVEYNFVAIVDGASTTTTLPETIPFTVTDGNGDLLYAKTTITTNANAVPTTGATANGLVPFTFGHLLSKVQFTVTNTIENYTIQVTGITVSGAAKEGTYTVSTDKWAQTGTTTTDDALTFGTTGEIVSGANAVASETRQILPVQQTLDITISYDIYFGGTKISSATKTGTITDQAFAKNTVYNIGATISGNQIQFTVEECDGFNPASGDINM